ncbi:GIY-YIG nuclease family protein [Wohlfahrtiimonas larvae]|uniref:GIY-YIG nuclease family protein n=1 Tax=Wohlfahrtiimonas larvae TaxID=1157986 RepID=A0ABP9MWM4_9GAMM|nr:GIY-YIG nuclease family protein [Wohlfahrtiimonas larvae]
MMRYYQPKNTYRPPSNKGNLYYVRFSTSLGYFYKIGFTTANSVEKRFSYNSVDFLDIDKVLLFEYLDNAYDIEQQLHSCLSERALFKEFKNQNAVYPLFKNGQSELYLEDILGLDPEYTEEQRFQTFKNVKLAVEQNELVGILKLAASRTADRILSLSTLPFSVYFKKKKGIDTPQALLESLDRIIGDGQIQKRREDNGLTEQAYAILLNAGINLHNR